MGSIPQGFTTVTPTLTVNGAARAIDLYKKAFGAKEMYRMENGEGKITHACIEIGNSRLFLADVNPRSGAPTLSASTFYVYLDDVDVTFRQARGAGMKEIIPVADRVWGDRTGSLEDHFGIKWTLATHFRTALPEAMEIQKAWGRAA